MKKILSLLLILCLASSLCACGATVQDASSANKLVYGEKYIRTEYISEPEERQTYFIFEKDRLLYHFYNSYSSSYDRRAIHYTVTYKYEIMDEGTLAYFFHSVTFHENHDNSLMSEKQLQKQRGILLFSENVLYDNSNTLFVRESYAEKELPNFGKETN